MTDSTPTPADATAAPLLDVRRDGRGVVRVWLNRPEVRNAFNGRLIRALLDAFTAIAADNGARVVVLGGHGKSFCAGADLSFMREIAGYSWDENRADAEVLAAMLWAIDRCPVPVVARVHGDCYAGGVGLAAACDVRVVASGVQFSLSEARLGLLPATIGPYVVRAMGEPAARRWFTTAERFDAAKAASVGFVHELVDGVEALDATVDGIVDAVLGNAPQAVRACKQLVLDVAGREITPELRAETARRIADIRTTDEGREGVRSFLEKRPPSWAAKPAA